MLRRSLTVNFAVSLLSTALMMSSMPTRDGMISGLRSSFLLYAQDDALLSPLIHRAFVLR